LEETRRVTSSWMTAPSVDNTSESTHQEKIRLCKTTGTNSTSNDNYFSTNGTFVNDKLVGHGNSIELSGRTGLC
jgi:hypothetical protein